MTYQPTYVQFQDWVPTYPYGTHEYRLEFARHYGHPYGAELTYKHRYHLKGDYKRAWDAWLEEGQQGTEPLPYEFTG